MANLSTGYHALNILDFTRHMRVPTILAIGTKKENLKEHDLNNLNLDYLMINTNRSQFVWPDDL